MADTVTGDAKTVARGVVGSAAYKDGRRIASVDVACEAAPDVEDGGFVWVGLYEPDEELLRKVQRRFHLHDLAIEDAHNAHQRPKLEVYGDSLFLVLRTVELRDGKVGCGETHVFAGRGYVVTVRHGSAHAHTAVRARCENASRMLALGEAFVLYSIMDFVVDNYFPVLHAMEEEVDRLEEAVFAQKSDRNDIERIYEIRHELTLIRRALAPLQEVCNRLMRFDTPLISHELHPYFRDVQDHVMKVIEAADGLREQLTSALEANLLFVSVQQSEVMRKLAGWAAILAVPTALAGIYGMNFEHMPELKEPLAYPILLVVIVSLCSYLYWRFRKAGWF